MGRGIDSNRKFKIFTVKGKCTHVIFPNLILLKNAKVFCLSK
ncbi:hypothetical protein [Moraxella lacunata]